MFEYVEETYIEEVIDEDDNYIKEERTRTVRKPINDIVANMLKYI